MEQNGLELLATIDYMDIKTTIKNLIYYDPNYTDDYLELTYSKNFDEILNLYEEKLYTKNSDCIAIAIFGSSKKFSFISTYKIYGILNDFHGSLFEFACDKELSNIKKIDDILYMEYM